MISELSPSMSRKCHECHVEKPLSEYYTDDPKTTWTSRRRCKDCYNKKRRVTRNGPIVERTCVVCSKKFLPKRVRNAKACSQSCRSRQLHLKRKGLTQQKFKLLSEAQGNRCLICKRKPKDILVIHHCHKTNAFLGLLCRECNAALGLFRDDPEIIKNALDFTEGTGLFSSVVSNLIRLT